MKIYVTDGNNRATLAITRSLGKKGHEIIVGERHSHSLAGVSKYCYDSVSYPDPTLDQNAFIDALIEQIKKYKVDVVIPVADITTFLIMENSPQISQFARLPLAEYAIVQKAADKKLLVDLSQKLNIPTPKTIVIKSNDNFVASKIDIAYPVVIKPSRSRVNSDGGWIYTTVSYAENALDLKNQIDSKHPAEFPILIQERIEGPGIGIFTCFNQGQPIALFSHQRLREKPPSGGVSVLRESISPHPDAARYSKQLLKSLNWHGVAMVEFKLDSRDNIPKIMEINGRFWGSLQLAIDAGVDFPDLLIRTLSEKKIEPILEYKIGVKSRWLLGDFDVLLMLLLKPRSALNLPKDYPSKASALFQFLKFFSKNQYYEVFRISDIKPFLFELRKWVKQ